MKHAIGSVEFMLQTKGFRDGAGGKPINPDHNENERYCRGWCDGRNLQRDYSRRLCKEMGLENPEIHTQNLSRFGH